MASDMVFVGDADCPSLLQEALPLQVSFVDIADFDPLKNDGPIISTYQALSTTQDKGSRIFEQLSNGMFLLLIPPFPDQGKKHTLTLPSGESFRIRLESGERVSLSREVIDDATLRTYDLETAGYFAEFAGRERGADSSGRPVLVEFQATNTSGGLICTTANLHKIAIAGSDQHRRDLTTTLVNYLEKKHEELVSKPTEEDSKSQDSVDDNSSLRSGLIDAGILTIYYYHTSDRTTELNVELVSTALPSNLDPDFSESEWEQFEREATQTGILTDSGVNSTQLEAHIDQRGLRSFARRITNE